MLYPSVEFSRISLVDVVMGYWLSWHGGQPGFSGFHWKTLTVRWNWEETYREQTSSLITPSAQSLSSSRSVPVAVR